jgi:hypothetical protein
MGPHRDTKPRTDRWRGSGQLECQRTGVELAKNRSIHGTIDCRVACRIEAIDETVWTTG